MGKPLTCADIDKVQEEVMAREAQASIDAGSKDLFDVWMVNYHKGTPEQREQLMQALAEHNEALRNDPFGWLYD